MRSEEEEEAGTLRASLDGVEAGFGGGAADLLRTNVGGG